jgi:uncharacterized membrane protein
LHTLSKEEYIKHLQTRGSTQEEADRNRSVITRTAADYKRTLRMPIVNFWVDSQPEGAEGRNAAFLVSHCIFCMFNILNVCYLILFEELTFQRLRQNHLLKLGFCACFCQIFSCCTSIHRYNIDDEYGVYGRAGTLISLVAFMFFNFTDLYLIFQRNTKAIRFGMGFWVVAGIACCIAGEANWETKNFAYFRIFVAVSTLSHVVGLMLVHRSLKHGSISIDESIASKETMLTMFKVLIFVDVMCMIGAAIGKPILSYPGTGLSFSVMVIAVSHVGRMDFMTAGHQPLATGGTSGGGRTKYENLVVDPL